MNLPLRILVSKSASVYIAALDRKTRERVEEKLQLIAADPYNVRLSKPLTAAAEKRSARIGKYRLILFIEIVGSELRVLDMQSRGQIYRSL